MLLHPDDLVEQMRNGQVVMTTLQAVPLVLEASSHPCGVCVTLHIGTGMGSGGVGFGLIVTRVESQLEDLCAQLGFATSDLTWRTSQISELEQGTVHSSQQGKDQRAPGSCSLCSISNE